MLQFSSRGIDMDKVIDDIATILKEHHWLAWFILLGNLLAFALMITGLFT